MAKMIGLAAIDLTIVRREGALDREPEGTSAPSNASASVRA